MAQAHGPEVRAAALAALATGASLHATARQFGIARTTLKAWRDASGLPGPTPVGPQKKADLGEQLYGYLGDSIAALRAQQRLFADPAWLQKQSAGELAILHGVITDKTIRLLGALRPDAVPEHPDALDIPDA